MWHPLPPLLLYRHHHSTIVSFTISTSFLPSPPFYHCIIHYLHFFFTDTITPPLQHPLPPRFLNRHYGTTPKLQHPLYLHFFFTDTTNPPLQHPLHLQLTHPLPLLLTVLQTFLLIRDLLRTLDPPH